jgi:hypothetical protein
MQLLGLPDFVVFLRKARWRWGLFAVDSDVAETLAVVALRKASLGLICFDFEENVGNLGEGEDCDFYQRTRVTSNNYTDAVTAGSSGEGRLFDCHLCGTDKSKSNPCRSRVMFWREVSIGIRRITVLAGVTDFGQKTNWCQCLWEWQASVAL